jgi:hypothetical protein
MRRSKNPYAHAVISALVEAAEQCDADIINEFLSSTIEHELEHLDLIEDTLSLQELIHRQRVISQGTNLLTLFNCIYARKVQESLALGGG